MENERAATPPTELATSKIEAARKLLEELFAEPEADDRPAPQVEQ